MNRDELLEECFGTADLAQPKKWLAFTEPDADDEFLRHVRAVVGVDYRRVLVRTLHPTAPGAAEATTTLMVAVLCHVCTDTAHRGLGYASALVESALEEAVSHSTIAYAVVVATDAAAFFERFGFAAPARGPDGLLVRALRDDAAVLGCAWTPSGRGW